MSYYNSGSQLGGFVPMLLLSSAKTENAFSKPLIVYLIVAVLATIIYIASQVVKTKKMPNFIGLSCTCSSIILSGAVVSAACMYNDMIAWIIASLLMLVYLCGAFYFVVY